MSRRFQLFGSVLGLFLLSLGIVRGQQSGAGASSVSPRIPTASSGVPPEGRVTVVRGSSNNAPVRVRASTPAFTNRVVRPSVRTNVPTARPVPARSISSPSTDAQGRLRQPTSLAFDEREKTVHLKPGEQKANFQWAVTNTSTSQVTVLSVFTSCGCTAAQLPTHPNPWVLKPGEGGHVGATMDVAGKFGTVAKMVTVVTSEGSYPLMARSVIPPEAADAMRNNMNRSRNLQVAAADRQAVFRGDCATCHVHPTIGKSGKELYNTACGICHEAEHRASMVTYLRDREGDFNRDYWEHWIRNGKEGSLMPAFESGQGGPLSDEQVQSLTDYLVNEYPLETNFPGKTSQEPPPSY